jgi:hypothetical protein
MWCDTDGAYLILQHVGVDPAVPGSGHVEGHPVHQTNYLSPVIVVVFVRLDDNYNISVSN